MMKGSIGNFSIVSLGGYGNNVHHNGIVVLKAGMTKERSQPRNHLSDGRRISWLSLK